MTQDAVQFSGAVSTVSGMASPACLTGRRCFLLVGSPSASPLLIINNKSHNKLYVLHCGVLSHSITGASVWLFNLMTKMIGYEG